MTYRTRDQKFTCENANSVDGLVSKSELGRAEAAPDIPWFRAIVVAALVSSIVITWTLWMPRDHPIVIPVLPRLPQIALNAPIIAASLAALVVPRAATVTVCLLLAFGMATDQTRMQPEFFSLPLLLWGSLPSANGRLFARMHLLSLWFFAGFHKLVSSDFMGDAGPRLLSEVLVGLPSVVIQLAVVTIVIGEIGTALLALVSATRVIAAWAAFILHAGVLVAASLWSKTLNIAIMPWNVALACSGFALIAPWQRPLLATLWATHAVPRLSAIALAIAPAGYYLGVVDAYPSHHLYSAGTARATIYCPAGCRPEQDLNASWHAFNVPLPPEPRLFKAVFDASCVPGDVVRITDPHPVPWNNGDTVRISACPAGPLPFAHP